MAKLAQASLFDDALAPAHPLSVAPTSDYSAKDIEVLEGLEPVRRRPGMYIGGVDERALHHLFAEVLDNAMDEAVAGFAKVIEVSLDAEGALRAVEATTERAARFAAGFACFVGRPNVGKSTLMNALVGSKVAITSSRPQTTRQAIRGIVRRPDAELVVIDTPGLHRPRTLLGERLDSLARATLTEVDDLRALLTGSFAPENLTFRAMVSAFAEVLATAVSIRRDRPEVYARLVQGALRAQMERDWLIQLGGILALVEEASLRRPL